VHRDTGNKPDNMDDGNQMALLVHYTVFHVLR